MQISKENLDSGSSYSRLRLSEDALGFQSTHAAQTNTDIADYFRIHVDRNDGFAASNANDIGTKRTFGSGNPVQNCVTRFDFVAEPVIAVGYAPFVCSYQQTADFKICGQCKHTGKITPQSDCPVSCMGSKQFDMGT